MSARGRLAGARRAGVEGVVDLDAVRRFPVADVLGGRLGRAVRGVLVASQVVEPIGSAGFARLRTAGPVLLRRVLLREQERGDPVGVQSAAIVSTRVPAGVLAEVAGVQPFDGVLAAGDGSWTAAVLGVEAMTVSDLSVELPWAAFDVPAAQITRLICHDGQPVAVLVDEIPRLPAVRSVGQVFRPELRVLFVRRVGRRVTLLRAAAGMTRAGLAAKAHISREFERWIERGTAVMRINHLEQVAAALGVNVNALVPFDDETIPAEIAQPHRLHDADFQLLQALQDLRAGRPVQLRLLSPPDPDSPAGRVVERLLEAGAAWQASQ